MQKRNNPFEKKIIKEVQDIEIEEKEEYVEPVKPAPVKKQPAPQRTNSYAQPQYTNSYLKPTQANEPIRDKFTSTMERELRRAIKVVCAQRGIMFAQFVEDACREKLAKEVK